jgi:hypothetical protein
VLIPKAWLDAGKGKGKKFSGGKGILPSDVIVI